MKKLEIESKLDITGGAMKSNFFWNKAAGLSMISGSMIGVLNLVNQNIYYNNPNPAFSSPNMYRNTSPKTYIRAAPNGYNTKINFGIPFA